jgi:hypothetical protein
LNLKVFKTVFSFKSYTSYSVLSHTQKPHLTYVGFYTYLYMGSILFMCYIFFYVLRVRVKGKHENQLELDELIKKMTQATGTI